MGSGEPITTGEMTALICEASAARPVLVGYGSGRLLNVPGNAWAFYRLGQIRQADRG